MPSIRHLKRSLLFAARRHVHIQALDVAHFGWTGAERDFLTMLPVSGRDSTDTADLGNAQKFLRRHF